MVVANDCVISRKLPINMAISPAYFIMEVIIQFLKLRLHLFLALSQLLRRLLVLINLLLEELCLFAYLILLIGYLLDLLLQIEDADRQYIVQLLQFLPLGAAVFHLLVCGLSVLVQFDDLDHTQDLVLERRMNHIEIFLGDITLLKSLLLYDLVGIWEQVFIELFEHADDFILVFLDDLVEFYW